MSSFNRPKPKTNITDAEYLNEWKITVIPTTTDPVTVGYFEIIGRIAQREFEDNGFKVLPSSDPLDTWNFTVYHENPSALTKFLLTESFQLFTIHVM